MSALQRVEDFRILKTSKKCDDDTESYSITEVPKMFLTVAALCIAAQG
jgi:hypothetical protein